MSLIINHNLTAMTASRFLGTAYGRLHKSIERLSSGLRINGSGDDPAGLALRELMRSDIAAGFQGIRNISDAISMVQTADGALAVINEKLIRMKALAEQAATGTYTDVQRELINSEYQAMAKEIDRIANASNFNGVKLLDGSMESQNWGLGIRIHFGTGNSAAEDYYYIKTGDVRATSSTGLRIGGDGKNDIWTSGPYEDFPGGCCGGGVMNLDSIAATNQSQGFAYGYNWDGSAASETVLFNSKYLAGRYGESGDSYQDIINNINAGTQSRVIARMVDGVAVIGNDYIALCLDEEEVYYRVGPNGNAALDAMICGKVHSAVAAGANTAAFFARAINDVSSSKYWAFASGTNLIIFRKDGGDNNNLEIEYKFTSTANASNVLLINAETGATNSSLMTFSLGGEHWGEMAVTEQKNGGNSITLLGKDVGDGMDLFIAGGADGADNDFSAKLAGAGFTATQLYINSLRRTAFTEIQDAVDARWDGAEIRTQEAAQKALIAVGEAILRKDEVRARIGAVQNTLEGLANSLTIQVENLQTAESRISDVDVANEMIEFTKNNILTQAATSMLAQANSLGALALSLITG